MLKETVNGRKLYELFSARPIGSLNSVTILESLAFILGGEPYKLGQQKLTSPKDLLGLEIPDHLMPRLTSTMLRLDMPRLSPVLSLRIVARSHYRT